MLENINCRKLAISFYWEGGGVREERKVLPLFTDLLSKCCSSIQQCTKSNKFFYRSVASFYWIKFLTIFIEARVSISNIICSGFTPNNTSLLLSCPLVGMVLGMFCKIFAVFGKQLSSFSPLCLLQFRKTTLLWRYWIYFYESKNNFFSRN